MMVKMEEIDDEDDGAMSTTTTDVLRVHGDDFGFMTTYTIRSQRVFAWCVRLLQYALYPPRAACCLLSLEVHRIYIYMCVCVVQLVL